MDKARIKSDVKKAYNEAREYPEFLDRFKSKVQDIIDSYVPGRVTHSVHVYKDIEYLSEVSRARDYTAKGFLLLVANYISMIVTAYENNERKINADDILDQYDLFDENPDDTQKE